MQCSFLDRWSLEWCIGESLCPERAGKFMSFRWMALKEMKIVWQNVHAYVHADFLRPPSSRPCSLNPTFPCSPITRNAAVNEEEPSKLWNSFASGFGSMIFRRILQQWEIYEHFPQFGSLLWKKRFGFFLRKYYYMRIFVQGRGRWILEVVGTQTRDTERFGLDGGLHSFNALVADVTN